MLVECNFANDNAITIFIVQDNKAFAVYITIV